MKHRIIFTSLLICVLASSCNGQNAPTPTQTAIPATSTSLPTEPPTATPTETPLPSPTPQPSPTPNPGVFLNRPGYLRELFSTDDWLWFDDVMGAQMGHLVFGNSRIVLVFNADEEKADKIMIRGIFEIEPEARAEDEAFFIEFVSTVMQDFLPPSAMSGLNKFVYTNTSKPAPGFYETTIEEFRVVMKIEDDPGDDEHNIWLEIFEK